MHTLVMLVLSLAPFLGGTYATAAGVPWWAAGLGAFAVSFFITYCFEKDA